MKKIVPSNELAPLDPAIIQNLICTASAEHRRVGWSFKLQNTQSGQQLLQLPVAHQKQMVLALIKHALIHEKKSASFHLLQVSSKLWEKQLPFQHDELVELIEWLTGCHAVHYLGLAQLAKQVRHYLKSNPLTEKLTATLLAFVAFLETLDSTADLRKQIVAFRELSGTSHTKIPLLPGDAWADRALAEIGALTTATRQSWAELFVVLQQANGGTPTDKWRTATESALDKLGFAAFKEAILTWFPLVDKPRTIPAQRRYESDPDPNLMLIDGNADLLRALVWLCARAEDSEIARALTGLAQSAYRKVPGVGPRCVRVGNACVWVLGNMPGLTGIQQLALLKVKVKFGTAQIGIEKALTAAAEREQMPRDEIEELTTPTYGLSSVGLRREEFGDFTAELQVTGSHEIGIRWFKADGKEQKSIPQAVKNEYTEELKELQQASKDIQKMLPALSERLDNLFLSQKQWAYEVWQERYLHHPLMGVLTRRLIWHFKIADGAGTTAIWHDGSFVDCMGKSLDLFTPETQVSLWHPVGTPSETILAWRTCLERLQIQQPFKQAHREVYLLTDAELRTEVYSNRFAAHVLKQHQFNSLCAARHWRNKLRLMVDDSYPPAMKELPEWGLRAEFWIEGIGDNYGVDTNESGVYLRLTTDQVRFYPIDTTPNYAHAGGGGYSTHWGQATPPTPLRLEAIPPLVFSEIMRDADLFVGVASLGNDPTWQDGGPDGTFHNYWREYAFGDLSESAKTRKAVLERLLPKLKIAKQCELQERFLVVHGKLRTYRIHLGSGNIMMDPNSQYLCIVPRASDGAESTGNLFLPFEGDRTLTIILSKAFLLANDTVITDPTILRQIKP